MAYVTEFDGHIELSRNLTDREKEILTTYFLDHYHNPRPYPLESGYCSWKLDVFDGNDILVVMSSNNGADVPKYLEMMIERYMTLWGITLDGEITATGSGIGDHWRIVVEDNKVTKNTEELVSADDFERNTKVLDYIKMKHPDIYNEALTANGYEEDNPDEDYDDEEEFVGDKLPEEKDYDEE